MNVLKKKSVENLINKIDIDAKNYKKGREYIKITFM